MRQQSSGLMTLVVVLVVFAGFGLLLYSNAQPGEPLKVIVPTQIEPTSPGNPWQDILRPGFGDNSTPLPTIPIPDQPFVAPTLMPGQNVSTTPFNPAQDNDSELFTLQPVSVGATPTRPAPTATAPSIAQAQVTVQGVPQVPTIPWQPPSLPVNQNRDPLGRDHYIFARPIDPDGQNFGTFFYPYGSEGLNQIVSANRIHHGIDMPNALGTTIRAAASGTVIFASKPDRWIFQGSESYGNVVAIEHDDGWNGQPVYTIYAHLEATLVNEGDRVDTGDPIALTGSTGTSSNPHLHFEVRVGQNRYGSTYNPLLWLVPYVNHGTIAGRLVDENDNFINDALITLRDWNTGLPVQQTKTYIFDGTVNQVNSDPNWGENFVFGDVPAGRYEVVAIFNGQRLSHLVNVFEGLTIFADLHPREIATPQPVTNQP